MSTKMFDNLRISGMHYGRVKNDVLALIEWMAEFRARVPHWDEQNYSMAAKEHRFADEWVRSGEIVYNLTHSLAALFSLTSAPEIDWDHLPHAAFIIKVPREYLPLPGTIEPEFSYLYVRGTSRAVLVVADYDTTAGLYIKCENGAGVSDFFERLNVQGAVKAIQSIYVDRELARLELLGFFRNDRTIGALPQARLDDLIDAVLDQAEASLDLQKSSVPTNADVGLNRLTMRFLSNTLAYLSEAQSSSIVLASSDVQRRPQIINVLPPRELVVQRAFRDVARDAVAATMAGSIIGIRRVLEHHVRGHWRNQAVGPAHSQRRRTWIHPHVRGSQDLGAVVRRIETLNIPVEPRTN